MIRVLHLIKGLGRGGAENLLSQGLRVADRSRYEYSYAYFVPCKNALVPELEAGGAEVSLFSARSSAACFRHILAISEFVRRRQIDVIHCHLPIASVVGRFAGAVAGVPVVSTEHNLLQRYHVATRLISTSTWGLQSRVIAVSNEVKDSILEHVGDDVPVDVILNGVDVERFGDRTGNVESVRANLGLPTDAFVIGTVAVFRTQKRLEHWLRVAASVLKEAPNAHFLLVGDGPERETVDREICRLRLGERVHLPGLQSDVSSYLSAMNVYLMTSEFEGLPIAMLEAMASRLPIVATSVGGIPEAVRHGQDGYLVAQGDIEGATAAVLSLVRDQERRRHMGRNARARVVESFAIEPMQRKLEGIYESVTFRPSCVGAA